MVRKDYIYFMITIAVGSTNRAKIQPVENIFKHHYKNVKVVGVAVPSGISEQPMSDDEIFQGALNRAKRSLKKVKGADYGVGIEGGLHKHSYGWFERGLVVIVNKKGDIGIGSSGGLFVPDKVMEHIHEGKTLEEAIDTLFGTNKIGEGIGMFGVFTKEVVTRAGAIEHGVAFAIARFLHKDLY